MQLEIKDDIEIQIDENFYKENSKEINKKIKLIKLPLKLILLLNLYQRIFLNLIMN